VIEHNDRDEHAWEIRDAYGYHPFEARSGGGGSARFLHGRSELERLRRQQTRTTGTSMAKALERVEEISAFRLGRVKVDKVAPNRLATIRANCNRVVTRETRTHGYATIAT
jgi:hypothetical protein